MKPLTTADLIFPSASASISAQFAALGKSHESISNRLRSIEEDSRFVRQVAYTHGLPIIANERCGSWYIPSDLKAGSAYYKSTDGHHGVWSCSLRRLNLGVLGVVGGSGGCIIVDSTRRGKHFPDALSKTVPIWCAVMNRLLFPEIPSMHGLERLSQLISLSEHSQIETRLDGFVDAFKSLDLDISDLKAKVGKPLRPIWVSRSLDLPTAKTMDELHTSDLYHPVLLCMSSQYQKSSISESYSGYVQGAGDDAESWALGLTPSVFWEHHSDLLAASEDELPELIELLVKEEKSFKVAPSFTQINPASKVLLGPLPQASFDVGPDSLVIICAPLINVDMQEKLGSSLLYMKTGAGKLGSRDLRTELSKLTGFLDDRKSFSSIFVTCSTGKDISAGVVLALLCLYVDDNGNWVTERTKKAIDKTFVRKRLSWITTAVPSANPSRTTLTAINAFLMKQP